MALHVCYILNKLHVTVVLSLGKQQGYELWVGSIMRSSLFTTRSIRKFAAGRAVREGEHYACASLYHNTRHKEVCCRVRQGGVLV